MLEQVRNPWARVICSGVFMVHSSIYWLGYYSQKIITMKKAKSSAVPQLYRWKVRTRYHKVALLASTRILELAWEFLQLQLNFDTANNYYRKTSKYPKFFLFMMYEVIEFTTHRSKVVTGSIFWVLSFLYRMVKRCRGSLVLSLDVCCYGKLN